jgi:hypothetical protein
LDTLWFLCRGDMPQHLRDCSTFLQNHQDEKHLF